jgi:acyl-CoA reductase-like NAD-dependent aldehyde dehydrogenase
MKEIKLFINGEFVDASDKKTFNTPNPSTGEILATCAMPTLADVDLAVEAAHTAFYSKEWRAFDQNKRSDLLLAIS